MKSYASVCKQQPKQQEQWQQQQQSTTTASQLPPVLQLRVLSLMPRNARVLSGRLVCRDAHRELQADDCTASLVEPLPAWAHAWAQEAGREPLRHMSFQRKVLLLCTAAASGSEVNLEVAWDVLLPSIFPELMRSKAILDLPDPGQAAVRAGHPQVLPWLVRHCPALLRPARILEGAANRCDLAGLRIAWEALQGETAVFQPFLSQSVLDAAAGSATADAVAKMEWLLAEGRESCRLEESTANAAVRLGIAGRLRWLQARGCPMGGKAVAHALEHADLAVVQWLVDEAGCELPAVPGGEGSDENWSPFLYDAVKGADGFAKLRWLEERGCTLPDDSRSLQYMFEAAVKAGQEGAVRYLLSRMGPDAYRGAQSAQRLRDLSDAAARSGSIPVAELVRQAGCEFTTCSYRAAGMRGDVAMFRWLAREAGVSAADMCDGEVQKAIELWPCGKAAHLSDLCEAMQLLKEAGLRAEAQPRNWRRNYVNKVLHTATKTGNPALAREVLLLGQSQDTSMAWAQADGGGEALLEFQAGQPGGLDGGSLYVRAAVNGDRGTLAALRRLGVPWGEQDTVVGAVWEHCGVPAVSWLLEQGAPVGSREEMDRAIERMGRWYSSDTVALLRGVAARESAARQPQPGAGRGGGHKRRKR